MIRVNVVQTLLQLKVLDNLVKFLIERRIEPAVRGQSIQQDMKRLALVLPIFVCDISMNFLLI